MLTPPRIAAPRQSPRLETRQRPVELPPSAPRTQQVHDVAPQQPVTAQEKEASSCTRRSPIQQRRAIVDDEFEDITLDAWSTPETSSGARYLNRRSEGDNISEYPPPPVRRLRVIELPPEEKSPQQEAKAVEEPRLEATALAAPQRPEMKKGTERMEVSPKAPRQLEPVPEGDESESSGSSATCDDPNCSVCQVLFSKLAEKKLDVFRQSATIRTAPSVRRQKRPSASTCRDYSLIKNCSTQRCELWRLRLRDKLINVEYVNSNRLKLSSHNLQLHRNLGENALPSRILTLLFAVRLCNCHRRRAASGSRSKCQGHLQRLEESGRTIVQSASQKSHRRRHLARARTRIALSALPNRHRDRRSHRRRSDGRTRRRKC